MKKLEVNEIIVPIDEDLSTKPSISSNDTITDAIEIMLKNDLNRIAVTNQDAVIGMIRLEDALKKIGLEEDLKAKAAKVIIRQGRTIIMDS